MKLHNILIPYAFILNSFALNAHEGDHKEIIESCVRGNLPQELQFTVAGNPIYLSGDTLSLEGIRAFAGVLDGRLKRLFKKAVQEAKSSQSFRGAIEFDEHFLKEVAFQIYVSSKDEFDVGFCGDSETVDGFLYAQIFGYIESSANSGIDFPRWVESLEKDQRELRNLIVVAALGLYLSGKLYDDYLVLLR